MDSRTLQAMTACLLLLVGCEAKPPSLLGDLAGLQRRVDSGPSSERGPLPIEDAARPADPPAALEGGAPLDAGAVPLPDEALSPDGSVAAPDAGAADAGADLTGLPLADVRAGDELVYDVEVLVEGPVRTGLVHGLVTLHVLAVTEEFVDVQFHWPAGMEIGDPLSRSRISRRATEDLPFDLLGPDCSPTVGGGCDWRRVPTSYPAAWRLVRKEPALALASQIAFFSQRLRNNRTRRIALESARRGAPAPEVQLLPGPGAVVSSLGVISLLLREADARANRARRDNLEGARSRLDDANWLKVTDARLLAVNTCAGKYPGSAILDLRVMLRLTFSTRGRLQAFTVTEPRHIFSSHPFVRCVGEELTRRLQIEIPAATARAGKSFQLDLLIRDPDL